MVGRTFYAIYTKRALDILFALICIAVFSPLLLIIAYVVKMSSPGPVFYRGVRSGQGGSTFRIFKFRTMETDAEKKGGYSTALNDTRLTRVGKAMRKYKLDEIPQLFNILLGDMSFVGPRPQVVAYTKLYTGEERNILLVKPGLTDYSSIHFINLDAILGDGDVDEKYRQYIEPEKNRLRMKYVTEQSLLTDLNIIFKTVMHLIKII